MVNEYFVITYHGVIRNYQVSSATLTPFILQYYVKVSRGLFVRGSSKEIPDTESCVPRGITTCCCYALSSEQSAQK